MLLVVGAGLFGSLAARYARHKGIEVRVFDPFLPGAASPAAAGLFKEAWAGKKYRRHFDDALPLLDQLVGIRSVILRNEAGVEETFSCVPSSRVLEPAPLRQRVTAIGDGWLEAGGQRHEGVVYVAAGVWCREFFPDLSIAGKAGAAYLFAGEQCNQVRQLAPGRQALAFARDPGTTYFSDGTAEAVYGPEHDQATLDRARALGLAEPIGRLWGQRPYTPGGPVFQRRGHRLWLATGGRKLGTILGAACARRFIDEELCG